MSEITHPSIANEQTPDDREEAPTWDDMPKPAAILTLSWEDIWGEAADVTNDKFGRMPTKEEIKELFEITMHRGMDCESDSFWSRVQYNISEYYRDKSE